MIRRALVVLAAVLAAAGAPAGQKGYRRPLKAAEVPDWVLAAAASPVVEGSAPAVVVYSARFVEPLRDGGVRKVERVAYRPKTPGALVDLGQETLFYLKGDRDPKARAWTVLPDGKIFGNDPVVDVTDLPYEQAEPGFDDSRVVLVSAPTPAQGAVLAYETSIVSHIDLGGDRAFYFAHPEYPVVRAELSVEVPSGWGVGYATDGIGEAACREDGRSLHCAATDVPAPGPQETRPPFLESGLRTHYHWWSPDGLRGSMDWDGVARWTRDLWAPRMAEVGGAAKLAENLAPRGPGDLLQAIRKLYSFAARDVRYVAISLGIGGWQPHSPSDIVRNRYGDCKDKSALIRSVLSAWGLETYPVLVLTREDGVVEADAPSAAQFNHVIAGVKLPDGVGDDLWSVVPVEGVGRVLLLDATGTYSDPWILLEHDQGTLALLVRPDGGTLFRVPVQPPDASRTVRTLEGAIDEKGTLLEASLDERMEGNAAMAYRLYWESLSDVDRRREQAERLQHSFPGARMVEWTPEGFERGNADVVLKTELEGGWFGKRVSQMLLVTPGSVGRGLFGLLPKRDAEFAVRLGAPREEVVDVTVRIPPGWIPEELPSEARISCDDAEAEAAWSFESGALHYRRTARLKSMEVSPERYDALRAAWLRMNAVDGTAIVFVRDTR